MKNIFYFLFLFSLIFSCRYEQFHLLHSKKEIGANSLSLYYKAPRASSPQIPFSLLLPTKDSFPFLLQQSLQPFFSLSFFFKNHLTIFESFTFTPKGLDPPLFC